jgi:transposase
MIEREIEAEILRLHKAEGWFPSTIASQLELHYSTVKRVLNRNGLIPEPKRVRRSIADPYKPFIRQTLEKYPKLNATRLYHMVKARGYGGGVDHFRDIVARCRPHRIAEAYMRLSTLPGEQAQCDWGHFGKVKIGNTERRVLAFVMVLSSSRRIFLRFYFGDDTANFLRGHVEAFLYWQAVPRTILYDNLKSAVIERVGNAIHFNPELLALAAHYHFQPKPTGVRSPEQKGKVERTIQYIRHSFFEARKWKDIDDLNEQAAVWCIEEATQRKWQQDKSMTVMEAFEKEKPSLLALPNDHYPVYDRKAVWVGKTPYVRFDLCDYSVPHEYVKRQLVVEATPGEVRVLDGLKVIAIHKRSFDKGKQIEDAEHIKRLVEVKKEGSKHRGMNRLRHDAPSSVHFFERAAERGHNLGRLTQLLMGLLDAYGGQEVEAALKEALAAGTMHSSAVQQILEKRRHAKGLRAPVPLQFTNRVDDFSVIPKPLDIYDQLTGEQK